MTLNRLEERFKEVNVEQANVGGAAAGRMSEQLTKACGLPLNVLRSTDGNVSGSLPAASPLDPGVPVVRFQQLQLPLQSTRGRIARRLITPAFDVDYGWLHCRWRLHGVDGRPMP